jgi:predicted transcriptional regulator of viral defense system
MSAEDQLKKNLQKSDFITLKEALELGVSPMQLSRMVAKGELFRVDRGVYAQDLDWLTDPLKKYRPTCTLIPEAIISGISALSYYNLTDQEERQIWITLPFEKKLKSHRFRVTRARGLNYSLGIVVHRFGKHEVRIYDMEKSVVDAFKYQNEEVAFKALKGYLKLKEKDISKLCQYAKKLKKPLDNFVRVILADE